jgi:Sugar efflux transporter for intercellular exchange
LYVSITASICSVAVILGLLKDYEVLGWLGVVMAVLLMGSPLGTSTIHQSDKETSYIYYHYLAVVRDVIANKSTAGMPFSVSAATWLNALSWSLYG